MTLQYKVVSIQAPRGFFGPKLDEAAEQLAEEVNREMSAGWEPQGGVAFSSSAQASRTYLLQALVRRR